MLLRYLKTIMFVCLFSVALFSMTAMSAEYSVSKTELTNVAQNKPIVSSDPGSHTIATYDIANLTDGDRQTFTLSEFGEVRASKESFTIDLLRRYVVEKVEIFDCYSIDASTGRQYIDVIGANNEDFSDAVTLGSLGELDDSLFAHQGSFNVKVDASRSYRYIKLQRTGGGNYKYAEIKVWAKQTVTDVARGLTEDSIITDALADSSHWVYAAYPPQAAFDGNTKTCWVEDGNAYRYMRVDLGKEYHIGMIEMTGRDYTADQRQDNYWSRSYINLYGSNTDDTENSIFDYNSAPSDEEAEEKGFKLLSKVGNMATAIDGEVTFPAVYVPEGNESTYGKAGKFTATVDDSEAFRYFIYKKTLSTGAALSTFSLYEINPVINSVELTEDSIDINFSDEMDEASIDASSIYLTDSKGNIQNLDVSKKDNYTFAIDISKIDKALSYKLTVEDTVKNQKNVFLTEKFEKEYEKLSTLLVNTVTLHGSSDGSGDAIDNFCNIGEVSVKANVSNVSPENHEVSVYIAQYDSDGMLKNVNFTDSQIKAFETTDVVCRLEIDGSISDAIVKTFVWEKQSFTPLVQNGIYRGNVHNIYVSATNGDDSGLGTLSEPFKTIERAQKEVRSYNSDMTEDINVYLLGGTYEIENALTFAEQDGGTNKGYINYSAYNNEEVIISGGRSINGFDDEDGDGIYSAYVTDEDISTIRELYVNGRKAVRAQSETKIQPVSMYEEDGKILGYYVNSSDIGLFNNPEDMQFHYSRGWASITINVKSVSDAGNGQTLVLMDDIPFELMTTFEPDESTTSLIDGKKYHIFWLTEQNKFYAENALELLDTEGEFYFDKKTRILYYKPLSGESMTRAAVYAPKLDALITVEGSDLDNKVCNIRFEGITFAHATNKAFDKGFLGDQSQTQILFEEPASAYAPDNIIVGANIKVSKAKNIEFKDNVFMGLAKVAVGLYDGAEDILIDGNAFYDIGDSAVTIGTPQDAYMEDMTEGKNVAYNKNVTSTVNEIGRFGAYANDGDLLKGWNIYDERTFVAGVTKYSNEYWQVDLGKPYEIDKIILHQRDVVAERTNFEILASNTGDFSESTCLFEIGDETDINYTVSGDITTEITDTQKYRYVRVRKTKDEYFYLPEIEIISNDETVPSKEVCKNNVITNNYITRVGDYNWGAPGVQAYYTEATEISSNYIYDVPYSGICFGWGWTNTSDSVTSKNTVVKNNRIVDYAQRSYDAGGIYTMGQEPGSEIYGNYIKNQINAYGAYYPDSGSAYSYVHDNVFEDIDMAYHIHSAKQYNLTVENNYSTNSYYVNKGENCTVEAPTLYVPTDVPVEAALIIASAGLSDRYSSLISKVPERRKPLTFEDMYGNVIEEDNPYILSIPTKAVLIPNYLTRKITEAQEIMEMCTDASDDAKVALNTAIEEALRIVDLGASADRTEVIEIRLMLINAIREFLNNHDSN